MPLPHPGNVRRYKIHFWIHHCIQQTGKTFFVKQTQLLLLSINPCIDIQEGKDAINQNERNTLIKIKAEVEKKYQNIPIVHYPIYYDAWDNDNAEDPLLSLIYSTTDHAIERPSKVEVPLPISSKINKLFLVALFKIFATSFISTMNVDWPVDKSSEAPTLVKILSTIPILA